MHKINSKKKKLFIFIIVSLIIIVSIILYDFNFSVWINYRKNQVPPGTIVWNTGLSYDIKVSKSGKIIDNSEKKHLTKEELKELKQLIKEFQNIANKSESKDYYKDGITIDKDNYLYSELNQEQLTIYERIEKIIR